MTADYSDRGWSQVRALNEREIKLRDVFERCGIIGISDITYKVGSTIPNLHCEGILVGLSYGIWDGEPHGMETEVWDVGWRERDGFIRAIVSDERWQRSPI